MKKCLLLFAALFLLTACQEKKVVTEQKESPLAKVEETESKETEQTDQTDSGAYPPSVMVDGVIYKDTGYVCSMIGCGNMDGSIESSVDGTKLPQENNQANFPSGVGCEYQRSIEGCIVLMLDGERQIFRDITYEEDDIPEIVANFDAQVKELLEDGTLLVSYLSCPDGFREMSGDYVISAENLRDPVEVGDTVTIWYNGMIMETDPAQIGVVYRIEKVE